MIQKRTIQDIGIKRFIREKVHSVKLQVFGFVKERELLSKTWTLIVYLVNILFTGYILHYTLTNFNPLSLGLASALIVYYVEWFVTLVKKKVN